MVNHILYSVESCMCNFCTYFFWAISQVSYPYNDRWKSFFASKLTTRKLFCLFRYALGNFKFGKVDVGRYPDAAAKYNINDSSKSQQLPTLILFKEGKEVERRPYADRQGKLVKFLFSMVNLLMIIFYTVFEVKNLS